VKLGKLSPKYHAKTLSFAAYLKADAPPLPPEKVFREYKIPSDAWGMFANDAVGDCTCAAIAHYVMLATAHTGRLVIPEVADVLAMYSAISGYVPGDDSTDVGAAITDALNYWQTVGLAGHKILGWIQINHANPVRRHQGIYIFGGNDVGVQLPAEAQLQFTAGETWDVWADDDGGILGGHCILEAGYGSEGSDFVTWGKGDQKATDRWSNLYLDEAYCVITEDWLNEASGLAPNMLDLDALTKDLQALKG